jgi:hypothetical protein
MVVLVFYIFVPHKGLHINIRLGLATVLHFWCKIKKEKTEHLNSLFHSTMRAVKHTVFIFLLTNLMSGINYQMRTFNDTINLRSDILFA